MKREATATIEGSVLQEAIELLEVCQSCDLHYDAWGAFCERESIHGLPVTHDLSVHEVVAAFLAKHRPFIDGAKK